MAGYQDNLNRIFGQKRIGVPNPNIKDTRSFPELEMMYYGETIVNNVDRICLELRRKPAHFIRYLKTRAGCNAMNTESKVILQKYITDAEMRAYYQEYLKIYVTCRECKSRDTILDESTSKLKCEACGISYVV